MLWFFDRGNDVLEIETRYDNASLEYVLEVRAPAAPAIVERFRNGAAFQRRLIEIEDGLAGQKWRRSGPPLILPEGWPDKTPSQ